MRILGASSKPKAGLNGDIALRLRKLRHISEPYGEWEMNRARISSYAHPKYLLLNIASYMVVEIAHETWLVFDTWSGVRWNKKMLLSIFLSPK